jgi:general stress protein 26
MPAETLTSHDLGELADKIKDIRIAMLTTQEEDGDFHSRPMATNDLDADGSMWFFTSNDSGKVQEIRRDQRISLTFSDTGAETYVATSGTAEIVNDRAKIDALWNDGLKAWFPNGKNDPNIRLLKVQVHRAEYWDQPGGKMMTLFQMAKAALTGQHDNTSRDIKLGDEK